MKQIISVIILLITLNYSTVSYEILESPVPVAVDQWATSIDGLTFLADRELQLYPQMLQFQEELESRLQDVISWLDDFEDSSLKGTEHLSDEAEIIDEVSSHPLMAFRMIRRFVNLKKNLLERVTNQSAVTHLTELSKANFLPTMSDYEIVMQDIIHLRHVYDLSVDDLINGTISSVQTDVGLTQKHVHEIALHAEKNLAFSEALTWLQPLIRLESTDDGTVQINKTELKSDVERISRNSELGNETLIWNFPNRVTIKIDLETTQDLQTVAEKDASNLLDKDTHRDQDTFYRLCRGEVLMTERKKSKLICFYDTKSNPGWLINPLKIEVHSWKPYLIRIYDVITEKQAEYLRNDHETKLSMANVIAVLNTQFNESDPNSIESFGQRSRLAQYNFIDGNSKLLLDLEVKIGHMTGLEVLTRDRDNSPITSSDRLLVSSYAFGGHFEFHVDNLSGAYIQPLDGDRIATFMTYLSDVKLGGDTAFPYIGISVPPIKKSALFWYNLLRNGKVDERSIHGACPLIMGHKWVTNTWIRSFASFQKRKCSLNPLE